ncbi:MAG TPA: hypothetical protein ENK04_06390 [Gammaproteobacteria bacterium]|nr:hypothetical protein [Gammaproteobacteria bacterium]
MEYTTDKWLVLFLVISAIFVTGCSTTKHLKTNADVAAKETASPPGMEDLMYRIGPGDSLEAYYYKDYANTAKYKLDLEDKIFINVYNHKDYSREATVLPDGTISIPKHGVIQAKGLTISELDAIVTDLHRQELSAPEVDVLIVQAQNRTNEFLGSLTSGDNSGTSKQIKVRTDGVAVLPVIGSVALGGLTIAEAQRLVTRKYKEVFNNIAVTLSLDKSAQLYVAVLGEVRSPGVYSITSPIVLHHALALAGGGETTADLEQIAILRTGSNGETETIFLNADTIDSWESNQRNNNYVMAGDIVFVPRTGIADINLFIDQYVRKMLPFTFSIGAFWTLGSAN